MKHLIFFISFFFLTFNYFLFPQDSTKIYQLSDVVVSATKISTPSLELANSVTVIDSNKINQSNKISLVDLLNEVPGLSITQSGGAGKLSYVYLRGGNSNHTLVLIDGVEINTPSDPSNAYDLANILTDDIQRIEILRGPQSILYGSDAISGVINIFTKKGNSKPTLHLNADGGSLNSFRGNTSLLGSYKSFDYKFNYSHYQTDGISAANEKDGNSEKDKFRENFYSTRLGYSFSDDFYIDYLINFTDAKSDLDQTGGKGGDDPNYIGKSEEFLSRIKADLKLLNGFWEQSFSFSFLRNLRKYNDDTDILHPTTSSQALYDGNRIKTEWQNILNINKDNIVLIGMEYEEERAKSSYFSESEFGPYSSVFDKQKTSIYGIYLQDQFKINNKFFTSVGVRYDHHQKFGSQFTYRIAPAFFIYQTNTKIKVTIGNAFKAPSLYYLFDPTYGNPNLNPEKNIGWDFGFEQFIHNDLLVIGVTYFSNDFKNLMTFDDNFKVANISKAKSNGVEAEIKSRLFHQLNLNLNYTFTETKNKSDNSIDKDKPLLRRPKHKISFNTNYVLNKNINFNIEVVYYSKRYDLDFSTYPSQRIKLKDYTLANFSTIYTLNNFISLSGRVENIFDADYEEVLGFGTKGRTAYLGLKLKI